ncbi:MAG: hypothetical protein ACYC8T_22005 [Myxococcaceae bacterium]
MKNTLLPSLVVVCFAAAAHADEKSEKAAADLLHARLANQRPDDAALLKAVKGKDVVVVAGSMDHIEQVLAAARIPFTLIDPAQVADHQLRSSMVLMVNCPGTMPDAGVKRVERFVRAGGLLYTTDWALQSVIMKAFPGTIAFSGRGTESEVVPVKIDKASDNLMSNMLLRKGSEPRWWLEGGSFPIKVLDPKKVEVLAHSEQMGRSYGASPVVVHFRWEDGEVIHVVSHFYRQMDTKGPQVAAADLVETFEGLSKEDKSAFKAQGGKSSVGDVESSYAFQAMTANIVTEKQKKNGELEKTYNMTVKGDVAIRSGVAAAAAPVATSKPREARMRVL